MTEEDFDVTEPGRPLVCLSCRRICWRAHDYVTNWMRIRVWSAAEGATIVVCPDCEAKKKSPDRVRPGLLFTPFCSVRISA